MSLEAYFSLTGTVKAGITLTGTVKSGAGDGGEGACSLGVGGGSTQVFGDPVHDASRRMGKRSWHESVRSAKHM